MVAWEECLFLIDHIEDGEKSVSVDDGLGEKHCQSVDIAVETKTEATGGRHHTQTKQIEVIVEKVKFGKSEVRIDVAVKSVAGANNSKAMGRVIGCVQSKTIGIDDRNKPKQIEVIVETVAGEEKKVRIDVRVISK